MIRVERLYQTKGNFSLKGINLTLSEGEYVTVLGPSGAGKTMFLETIMGLHRPESGRVFLNGTEVTNLPPERRCISYLPQDLAIFPHLSVLDNILFGARMKEMKRTEIVSMLAELTKLLNLEGVIGRKHISTLSGGEKQRVALARALMTRPLLLLLDEPLSALDAFIKRQLQIKLREINRTVNTTIIHVTHDREEAFMLGGKIAVMINGKIEQVGNEDDLYYRPVTLPVAKFLLNNCNIFKVKMIGNLPEGNILLNGDLPLIAEARDEIKPGDLAYAGIRPEEVMVIRSDRPLSSPIMDNQFDCLVIDILKKGGTNSVFVKPAGKEVTIEMELPNYAFQDLSLRIGKHIKISLKKKSLCVLPDQDRQSVNFSGQTETSRKNGRIFNSKNFIKIALKYLLKRYNNKKLYGNFG